MLIIWVFHEDATKHGTTDEVPDSHGRALIRHGRARPAGDDQLDTGEAPAVPDEAPPTTTSDTDVDSTHDTDVDTTSDATVDAAADSAPPLEIAGAAPVTGDGGRRGGRRAVKDAPQA